MTQLNFLITSITLFITITACNTVLKPTQPTTQPTGIALAWNQPEWSAHLTKLVQANLATFNKAKDIEAFCPTYSKLDQGNQTLVWSTLIVGIAKYESNYKPKTVFHEPAPLNVDSIGLFQMSYKDRFCPKSKADGDLQDPIVNINCAVTMMVHLVGQDQVITNDAKKGLARYWSVIRSGHHVGDIKKIVSSLSVCK